MLRVAVPNKGSLAESAAEMLRQSGYRQRRDGRELVLVDHDNLVEFFYLRPRDVATYVGAGTVDVGITGRDLLLDSESEAVEHLPLGFAKSNFRFAAPIGEMTKIEDLAGKRVATSYPRLVKQYLQEHNIVPKAIVQLDGAVESSVKLGVADAIADVVETGTTLRAAGLETFGAPIIQSEAVLITAPHADLSNGISKLARRLIGVITAREWVLMDYLVSSDALEAAVAITPGLESPTISPLHDPGWVAVRVMARIATMNHTMDELHEVGARGIVATAIQAARF
ncbi:MAG: ATP phosphoribosyltransferase [Cellulomonadaceae bacterium]|jgi:ATP phosphoribosyltransferase|nr:ATP phosphoribosyltransferase [Cellulomonadaceae bacterium]